MKRTISIILILVIALSLLCGCKKESNRPFDYDLSKYITLGEYKGIEYTYKVEPVTQEGIDDYINSALVQKGYGEEKTITDRAVKVGDTVNISYVGTKDGVAFEGGTADNHNLTIGSGAFIPGFEDGLVGAKTGEKRTLNLTFPENYHNEELKGQAVVFEVTVNSIKGKVYPELTDVIVAEISDKKTVDEYLEYVNAQVLLQNTQNAENKKESDIWQSILANVTVSSYPEKEVKRYKEMILKDNDNKAQAQLGISFEEYLKTYYGQTLEDAEPELIKSAEQAVKEYMTMVAIARAEGIEITDAEYNDQLVKLAEQNGYKSAKEFQDAIDEKQFYLSLLVDKVLPFVVENAKNVGEK